MASDQLTKNFYRSEFNCHDGTPVPEKYYHNVQELAQQLQIIRNELGEPLRILSGYRTPSWNKKVGGKPKSQHLLAKAADLTTRDKTPKQLKAIIEKLIKEGKVSNGGLGLYPGFIHFDIGPVRRW